MLEIFDSLISEFEESFTHKGTNYELRTKKIVPKSMSAIDSKLRSEPKVL